MTVSVNGVSESETLIDMAAKPTYTLKANASSVNFGSAASFSLSTTNLPNATQVFYTLSGVSAASDLGSANLTGSVNIDPSGKATISIPTLNHTGFQGNKTLTLTINDQTASETLIDTNQALNISATSASVIEGNNANFIVSSVNVPVGTAVPYSITGSVAATATILARVFSWPPASSTSWRWDSTDWPGGPPAAGGGHAHGHLPAAHGRRRQ
jgi:hypothetical protein